MASVAGTQKRHERRGMYSFCIDIKVWLVVFDVPEA